MSWKNLKIGSKLTIAFGIVLFIAVSAIGYSIFNLIVFGNKSKTLSNEYIPLSKVSNNYTNSAQKAIIAQNNYATTLQKDYLDEGKRNIDSMKYYLQVAKELVQSYASLAEFQQYIKSSEEAFVKYSYNFEETSQSLQKIGEAIIKVDELRKSFVEASTNYIVLQNQILGAEVRKGVGQKRINERLYRIISINSITIKANEAFNLFYTANLSRSIETIDAAITNISDVEKGLEELHTHIASNKENEVLNLVINSVVDSKTIITDNKSNLEKIQIAVLSNGREGELLSGFQKIIETSLNNTQIESEHTAQTSNQAAIILVISLILTVIVAIIFAYKITSNITKTLNSGVKFAKEIAMGNLDVTIDINQKDEIGLLSMAIMDMTTKLKEIVLELSDNVHLISSESELINTNAQVMAKGANSQAAAAQQVSSSMEQMVANIHQNTHNSKQTEHISKEAAKGVKNGSETALTAVNSMKQIADKISIINDIAFQTNILALNAAVEAARAGEHGRGFAVVASEVRKLAERSKVAAEDIDQLSKSGVLVSEAAGQQLQAIVPEIEKTAKLIQDITAASIEQNSGADQINNALQQLNNVTQQNAATTDVMAISAEKLFSQSEKLKGLISFFKVRKMVKPEISKRSIVSTTVNKDIRNDIFYKKEVQKGNYRTESINKKLTVEPKFIPNLGLPKNNIGTIVKNTMPKPTYQNNNTRSINTAENVKAGKIIIQQPKSQFDNPASKMPLQNNGGKPLEKNSNVNKKYEPKKSSINKGVTIIMSEANKITDDGYERF